MKQNEKLYLKDLYRVVCSWRGLCGDQPESGFCSGRHHANISRDDPGWSWSAGPGRSRKVWAGSANADERNPRRAEQNVHHHQWLHLWLWVKTLCWKLPQWFWKYLWLQDKIIFDSVPKVQFRHAVHVGSESSGQISATVYRSGDISYKSTVRCYSRQGTAQVMMDFNERPNTDASIITFLPGGVAEPDMCLLF